MAGCSVWVGEARPTRRGEETLWQQTKPCARAYVRMGPRSSATRAAAATARPSKRSSERPSRCSHAMRRQARSARETRCVTCDVRCDVARDSVWRAKTVSVFSPSWPAGILSGDPGAHDMYRHRESPSRTARQRRSDANRVRTANGQQNTPPKSTWGRCDAPLLMQKLRPVSRALPTLPRFVPFPARRHATHARKHRASKSIGPHRTATRADVTAQRRCALWWAPPPAQRRI